MDSIPHLVLHFISGSCVTVRFQYYTWLSPFSTRRLLLFQDFESSAYFYIGVSIWSLFFTGGLAVISSSSLRHYTILHSPQPIDLNRLLVPSDPMIRLKCGRTQPASTVRQTIQQMHRGVLSEIRNETRSKGRIECVCRFCVFTWTDFWTMGHQVQHGSICRLPASFQNLQGATGGFGVTDRGPIGRYFNYNVFCRDRHLTPAVRVVQL